MKTYNTAVNFIPFKVHVLFQTTYDEGKLRCLRNSNKILPRSSNQVTRGVAMSFGFRQSPTLSTVPNPTAARRLAIIEDNRFDAEAEALGKFVSTDTLIPMLVPPKKVPNVTSVSRFGFR